MSLALTALNLFAPTIQTALEKLVPDTDARDQIQREIKLAVLEQQDYLNKQAGDIVLAEAKSDNWLTAAWRPLLMMVIVAIVAVHFLLFPVVNVVFGTDLMIELPEQLWNLLSIGVGGYVVGRSGEKIATNWKDRY